MPQKSALKEAVLAALVRQFDTLMAAASSARAGATDGESRSEGKYDTRSTEANYLADGQARQAELVGQGIASIEALEFRDFAAGEAAGMGALVEVKMGRERIWFLLAPAAGGLEVVVDGVEVTVVTPQAPLGGQLMGARPGSKTKSPPAEVVAVR